MQRYYLQRTIQAVITVLAVMTLSFFMIRLLPGGPADALRAQLTQENPGMSQAAITRQVQSQLNLVPDTPTYIQYLDYLNGLLHGNFGQSLSQGESVAKVIAGAAPWTIFVMGCALLLAFVAGISMGAVMAYREGSRFDQSSTVLSVLMNSVPNYIYGILMLWILGYVFQIFPTGGRFSAGVEPIVSLTAPVETLRFFVDALWHAAMPILSVALVTWGGWALGMRSNSIQVLGQDYLRVAQLRGLPTRRIALRYVGRNAVLPMYTSMLITLGFLLGGSVIIEEVFSYPGMGYYMIEGLSRRDYPLMMGVFLVITVTVAVAIFLADITYGLIDPRASATGGGDGE